MREPGADLALWRPEEAASPSGVESCPACTRTGRRCPSCVQRRRHAWSLVAERGESEETVARDMDLPVQVVQDLVVEEADRRELRSLRCDSIPVDLTRAAIAEALRRDPDLTIAQIARWLDMPQVDFERAYQGTSKNGRPKHRVNVSSASRLMIALGRAPNELPGC